LCPRSARRRDGSRGTTHRSRHRRPHEDEKSVVVGNGPHTIERQMAACVDEVAAGWSSRNVDLIGQGLRGCQAPVRKAPSTLRDVAHESPTWLDPFRRWPGRPRW
jgi:hypothetical protein